MCQILIKKNGKPKSLLMHGKMKPLEKNLSQILKEALKHFGYPLEKNCPVKVVEEKNNEGTLVLPRTPVNVKELSEVDLLGLLGVQQEEIWVVIILQCVQLLEDAQLQAVLDVPLIQHRA